MTWVTRHARVLLALYAAFLVFALLSPGSGAQSSGVGWLAARLVDVGVPESLVGQTRMEFVMNALIIAPVPFLGSILLPSYSWRDWTAVGFAGALFVEVVQGVLLADRNASYVDVVANTLGAFLGAWLAHFSRLNSHTPVA